MNNKEKNVRIWFRFLFDTAIIALFIAVPLACKKQIDSSSNSPAISPLPSAVSPLPTETILVGNESFTVELAYKNHTRQQGLMYRKELAPDAGMLFLFPNEKKRTFYMKNCLIDLDILFLQADGTIVKCDTMKAPLPAKPLIYYSSDLPAKYALELPVGTIRRLRLQPGQKLRFPSRILNILPDPD